MFLLNSHKGRGGHDGAAAVRDFDQLGFTTLEDEDDPIVVP